MIILFLPQWPSKVFPQIWKSMLSHSTWQCHHIFIFLLKALVTLQTWEYSCISWIQKCPFSPHVNISETGKLTGSKRATLQSLLARWQVWGSWHGPSMQGLSRDLQRCCYFNTTLESSALLLLHELSLITCKVSSKCFTLIWYWNEKLSCIRKILDIK